MKKKPFLLLLISLFLSSFTGIEYGHSGKTELQKIVSKRNIRIVVTDSGIGGLSVMSDIADKISNSGSFKNVELIFVNALFDKGSGYNALQTREVKIEVFNKALKGIKEGYKPDLIFVACNTLSVLIPDTPFVHQKKPPVIGIIEPGVELILESLIENNDSDVIIFGTETTIDEQAHKEALLKENINESRIITKSCPQLQSYIEQDPMGEETEMLISFYMNEALAEISHKDAVVNISLNCSHFGYSEQLWRKALVESGYPPGEILNPNNIMGDILITKNNINRFSNTNIAFLVVSKVELVNVGSMVKIFEDSSDGLVSALNNYKIIPNLF